MKSHKHQRIFLVVLPIIVAFYVAASPQTEKKAGESVSKKYWKPSDETGMKPSVKGQVSQSGELGTKAGAKGRRAPTSSTAPKRKDSEKKSQPRMEEPLSKVVTETARKPAQSDKAPTVEIGSNLRQELRELESKYAALQESLDRLDAELDILREQSRLTIQRTNIGFRNQLYLRLGTAIVSPRPRTFNFPTDTGIGVFLGFGKYFGKQHVLELSLDWELYLATTFRYHYQFQSSFPVFVWGPVLGIKTKIANVSPPDNFLADPGAVKSAFWCVGGLLGFPIARSLVSFEFLYLANRQSLFLSNLAFHFFW